ncbi:DUF262 domain-containing protein [Corallococcus exiguus]|uniref:DUF262 domain-containing protein n=1 Tax=Corallococcus exiguus TaxID=83462 RepID=UPI001475AB07|nr:DUF262 domain-containing protein [Corallococcus exiguus]NNB98451.1 DUF262 domain-containing protein [Corallococcus exiguus]
MGRMFETPVLPRLRELLEEVQLGTIQIPAFQRNYIWSDEQRLRLMDSIWRGIPIGSLLVWRTIADKDIKVMTQIGPCELPQATKTDVRSYLVDGLQRVITLYAALMPLPQGLEKDEDGRRWPIYFELDPKPGDDLRFRLRHGQQPISPTWLPLSHLLDDERFFEFRTHLVDIKRKDLLDEARRLESRFRDYTVPVIPLVSDDESLVTEAFTRVNSLGSAMDEGDMAHALTSESSTFNFNGELATLRDQLSPLGWHSLDRKVLISTLKAIWNLDIYKSGAKGLQHKLKSIEGRELLRALPEYFEPATDILRNMGVFGPGSLPYAYQLVTLVRATHRLGRKKTVDANEELRRWFFWTTYQEHFTGMTSGQLRMEFERIEELILGRRKLDWLQPPVVGPVRKLRASSVRSRAAVLVMALSGDREAGGKSKQQQIYGAMGTEALHRLFAEKPAYEIANRVLASDQELKILRKWIEMPSTTLPLLESQVPELLRRNLLPSPNGHTSPEDILYYRASRIEEEERRFVEELGGRWEPSMED